MVINIVGGRELRKIKGRSVTEYEKFITNKEREMLIDYANTASPSVRMAVHLMDKLGLRVSEAVRVKLQDIDWINSTVDIFSTKQKRVIQRIAPSSLMKRLEVHCRQFKKLFKENYICYVHGHGSKSTHLRVNTVHWFFTKFRKKYDLKKPYYIRKNGDPLYRHASHVLRSNWISKFYEASGNNIRLTQLEIGHKKPDTTMKYVRFFDRRKRVKEIVNASF